LIFILFFKEYVMKASNPFDYCFQLQLTSEDTTSIWLQRWNEFIKCPPITRVEPKVKLIEISSIDDPRLLEALIDVINGHALAVRIPNAYGQDSCAAFRQAVDTGCCGDFVGYEDEPNLERIQLPLYEAAGSGRLDEYFNEAFASNWDIQRRMLPYLAPTSLIHTTLDKLWPSGAQLLRVNGKTAPFGICRKVRPGGAIGIHADLSQFDYPVQEFLQAKTNLSFLIYASNFDGGELELYPDTIHDQQVYNALTENNYALKRSAIGEPMLTLKPNCGDAVIFDARRLHGVRPVTGNAERYSVSGFVLVNGLDLPLGLYH
jgi:hypothetical protein